jgi:archaemetzincin
MLISILPFGDVDSNDISVLVNGLSVFKAEITVLPHTQIPQKSYNINRNQCNASYFLKQTNLVNGTKVLGVTEIDLYVPELNFVFGLAEIGGKNAVISLHRLKWTDDKHVFNSRIIKEALHELGHTFGLFHCSNMLCVMHFSNSIADTDKKSDEFCVICKQKLPIKGER